MSMPRYAAQKLRQAAALAIHPLPFPVPPYQIKIYLHRKNGRLEACRWLRQLQALAAHNAGSPIGDTPATAAGPVCRAGWPADARGSPAAPAAAGSRPPQPGHPCAAALSVSSTRLAFSFASSAERAAKQAELVQFRQLIAAVAAHVDEKQPLFTGERRGLRLTS